MITAAVVNLLAVDFFFLTSASDSAFNGTQNTLTASTAT